MRLILLFLVSILFLYSDNVEITKYISNGKPKVTVEYSSFNKKLLEMMKIDFKVIGHFDYRFKKVGGIDTNVSSDYLIKVSYNHNTLNMKLFDSSNKLIKSKKYHISNFRYYPFLIHRFAFDVNKLVGGEPVPWILRKVVYSVYTAPKESSIFIADYSLRYRHRLISGGLNIFPKWADKSQSSIYYTSIYREPTLYRYNIYSGKKEKLLSSEGMLIVSDVKGSKLLLTMAVDDQPDIYQFDINTRKIDRLTTFKGVDVSGKFYSDNSIVFISNRMGMPYAYIKKIGDIAVSKLLFFGKNQVSLSAYKNKFVVSTRESSNRFTRNTFNLFLSEKNSNIIKRLTFKGKNLLPVFSDDGSSIMFIKDFQFSSKVGIIRLKENLVFYYPINKKLQSLDW